MTDNSRAIALASRLARQLDIFLDGDRSGKQVGEIEAALADADLLAGLTESYQDLEYAVAIFAPTEGEEYLGEAGLEPVIRMARQELAQRFGV